MGLMRRIFSQTAEITSQLFLTRATIQSMSQVPKVADTATTFRRAQEIISSITAMLCSQPSLRARAIITGGYYSTINAGEGRNKIYVGDSYYNHRNTILSSSGADLISISGDSYENSIIAGGGNNTIYGGLGSNNTVTAGAGDDKVTVGGSSYVNVGNGKNNISISSGSNVKIISGGGSDIINVASSKSSRYSNNIQAGAGNNFINNSNVMQSTITAGTGKLLPADITQRLTRAMEKIKFTSATVITITKIRFYRAVEQISFQSLAIHMKTALSRAEEIIQFMAGSAQIIL